MNMTLARSNLEKLLSTERGGGMLLLTRQQRKEPRAFYDSYPLITLPFRYHPDTGSIDRFTRTLPQEDLFRGSFQFILCYKPNWSSHSSISTITGVDYGMFAPTREAVTTLNATAILYNNLSPIRRSA